ncbi:hypothetical protein [uncultured Thiodictyon sp.]|uniref:hypothetical protein n=1 Tax=uncultured Thiodictyon sp. TaxID=1846217 RepID=UPI0025EC8AF3|nr:hypothetical protein [uncultured Thiodictyon sp.]
MRTRHYFPQAETDRINWLKHYIARLLKHGPRLGLGAEEMAATQADIDYLIWVFVIWNPAIQQYSVDATTAKGFLTTGTDDDPVQLPTLAAFADPPPAVLPGVFNRLFNQVQRLKLHPAYTEAIGQDLGILGSSGIPDEAPPTFTLTVEKLSDRTRVCIDYPKHGHGGVVVDSRINQGDWLPLGHFTQKTIHDDRALVVAGTPESRDYRLRWWDKDEAHGEWSLVQTVLVGA